MVQDRTGSGQQTKPSDGATVEVLNQTPNLEEASNVKSGSHSTLQEGTKADSHSEAVTNEAMVAKETDEVVKSKPLLLKDEDEQSDTVAAERGVAKESDEVVKSKPLSLRVGDSQDRQPDSAATSGQISKEVVQNSGTTLTDDSAISALELEPKHADSKQATTTDITIPNNEPKLETAPSQDLGNHKFTPVKSAVSANEGHTTTQSFAAGIAEGEACGEVSSQDGSSRMIESGQVREKNVTASSQIQRVEMAVQDTPAVEVIPSAPALIDFSDEAQQSSQQMANVQTVASMVTATMASVSAEGTEDASKILYPRLDSIMQGTNKRLLYSYNECVIIKGCDFISGVHAFYIVLLVGKSLKSGRVVQCRS